MVYRGDYGVCLHAVTDCFVMYVFTKSYFQKPKKMTN